MNSHVLSPSLLQRCLSLQQFGLFILSNERKRQQVHTSKNNFLCVFKCPPPPRCCPLQTSQIHRFTQNTVSTKNMVYWTGLNDAMLRHCICINNALAEKHKMILFFPASEEISVQVIPDKGHWTLSKSHSFDRL